MALNDIVNVVITRQTQSISQAGFGIPLILGANNRFTDRIRFYSNLADVALDFLPSDAEYIAAQDVFAQDLTVESLAIGRRQVDNVVINVETPMSGEDYSIFINGDEYTVSGTSAFTYSLVTLNNDLVPGNRISVKLNGAEVGTVTSQIDFSADFVASNSIVATVNGTPLSANLFTTDQATTIAAVATKIASASGVASATVTGPRQITVVFSAPGNNTVNSVVTTLGASQPTANIGQGGFVYATSSAATMQTIATALENSAGVDSAFVDGLNNRVLTVSGPEGVTAQITGFVVSKGASQTTVTNNQLPQNSTATSIGQALATAINADINRPANAVNNNGVLTLTSISPGTAYTVRTSTSITNPNKARVRITQVLPNSSYDVTINNVVFSYVTPNNIQNSTQIATALVDLINANLDVPVDATNNNDGSFELESQNSTQNFSLRVSQETMSIQQGLIINPLVPSQAIASDLDAVRAADNNWYGLVITDRTVATVLQAAAWTESNEKLFGTASNDPQIINLAAGDDTTSIAAQLGNLGYNRTFVMYHQDALIDYPEAAWFGNVLPLEPGSETWKFKQLRGVSYSNLTTNQSNNVLGKKANTYEFVAGVGITGNGTVISGEYIDVIRGIDWLKARIQEYVFSVLVNNPKVPYTDRGIATIQAEVLRALKQAVDNDFLTNDPSPVVTVPKAANVSSADKNARILRNVVFTATLAGAIHFVQIRGTISV